MARSKNSMEESTSDVICQQVVDRYSKSFAPQHRNLCKTAISISAIIKSKSLPLTPLSYFDTIIETLSHTTKTTPCDADLSALSLFLEIVLPLLPENSITMSKAAEATVIVVEALHISSFRAFVECLGILLKLCDLDNWESVHLGFQTLIKIATHECPLIRECALNCLLKVFESFKSPAVQISAGNLVLESLKIYKSLAVKADEVSHFEQLNCMTVVLEVLLPCLPSEVVALIIGELTDSVSAELSFFTRHVLNVMEAMIAFFESQSEVTLADTIKISNKWNHHYSLVIGYMAGLLKSEASATRVSNDLQNVVHHLDIDQDLGSVEPKESVVVFLYNALLTILSTDPNEHCLAVISCAFLEYGKDAHFCMVDVFVELAKLRTSAFDAVKKCIGIGVAAMGPDKVLELFPISVDSSDLSCANTWLIPFLKHYVIESSLGFFIRSIVPLAESLEEACLKVNKDSLIRENLLSYARGCWGLLPAFCRYPIDMDESFESLAKLLISHIKKDDPFMLQNIAIALQHLVKQNKDTRFDSDDEIYKLWEVRHNEETAARNIKALSSWSGELLKAFTKVFFETSPANRVFVKDSIECLTLVTELSTAKAIFFSSLDNASVDEARPSNINALILVLASSFAGAASLDPVDYLYNSIEECFQEDDEEAYATLQKLLVISSEFMSSHYEQLMDILLNLKSPAVHNISSLRRRFLVFKILLVQSIEIHCDGAKVNSRGYRMLQEIMETAKDSKEESRKMADDIFYLQFKEESRKMAEDILLQTSSILQEKSSSSKTPLYYDFITMIMWYFDRIPLYIRSDAVFALSLLVANDPKICHLVPNLVPAIFQLLDGENDTQVINGVLGFMEAFVSNAEVRDLQMFLSGILRGILPWSYVFEHDFGLKVIFILKTMTRKCGYESVNSHVPEKYRDFVKFVSQGPKYIESRVQAFLKMFESKLYSDST